MTDPAPISAAPEQGPVRRCPICRKPRKVEFAPFCSQRCKDRDLLQWLDEGYALPGPPAPGETDCED
ncbi:DNA gyrase inhibitor YacG [Novosphingobium sp.]|uniref:DNA gyrase inhibitor YacG n=1 Tax=Novosphingobium sp. TaxID=1874826 RepID=UPI0025DE4573|nr:DNA gyrase inhibitor YacG [Novosphingobium sp.]